MTNTAELMSNTSELTPPVSTARLEKAVAILAAFIGLGAGYSSYASTATTFILPLTHEFGWGRIVPSLMYVCSMTGIGLASIWLGKIIERFGAPRVAAVSGLCLAGVQVLLGSQNGSPALALVIAFLAGTLGAGTSVGLYLSTLSRWFDRDLGRALGFSVMGISAAVQLTFTLCAVLLLVWLARRRQAVARAAALSEQSVVGLSEALRTRTFWLLAAMTVLATLAVFGPAFQIVPLYADRGVAPAMLPIAAMAIGIGTLIGRLCSGILLDLIDARIVAFGTFLAGAAGSLCLAVFDQVHSVAAICIPPALLGAALGAESDILAYMARRFYGLRDHAAVYNRVLVAFYVGAVIGPLTLGWAFDHRMNPSIVLTGIAMCCLAASGIAAMLPSPGENGLSEHSSSQ
jgi:OFA family oxalate/formate antiporter-like MFS transporter